MSETYNQLSEHLQMALAVHQDMQDRWNDHIAKFQQPQQQTMTASRFVEPVDVVVSIQNLVTRAQLLNTRQETVKEKGVPDLEPINVMHRLADLMSDMIGTETKAHRLERAVLQLTTLIDTREETVQELEDGISRCLPMTGDTLSKLWQDWRTARWQKLCMFADGLNELELLLARQ